LSAIENRHDDAQNIATTRTAVCEIAEENDASTCWRVLSRGAIRPRGKRLTSQTEMVASSVDVSIDTFRASDHTAVGTDLSA
jgi:hypothetical protein